MAGWAVTCACCHSALEAHSGVLGASAKERPDWGRLVRVSDWYSW